MSTKVDKFKNLLPSPHGSVEQKHQMIDQVLTDEKKEKKKKATFELDAELHRWLKIHAAQTNQKMVDVIEALIRKHHEQIDK